MRSARLPGGRLHLQHGPIDLVIGAEEAAYPAAAARFSTVLEELVCELPLLRRPLAPGSPRPVGAVARRMEAAARPHQARGITPMAAVAGAVADEVLAALPKGRRAYVNNGGDIALRLGPGERHRAAMAAHDGREIGRIEIAHGGGIGGIATSGRHGRSFSLGIADSVTVLAPYAAEADAAATMIANAVDLPGHPAIGRRPARDLDEESDLGTRPVIVSLGPLAPEEIDAALAAGLAEARAIGLPAALTLRGRTITLGAGFGALAAA